MLYLAKVITKLSKNSIIVKPVFPLSTILDSEIVIKGDGIVEQIIAIDYEKTRQVNNYDSTIKNLYKQYRIFYKLSKLLDSEDFQKIKELTKEYKLSQIEDMISKNEIKLKIPITYAFNFDVKIKLICKQENGIHEILKLKELLKEYKIIYLGGGKYKILGSHNSNNQSEVIKIIKTKAKEIVCTEFQIYDFRTK